MFTRISKDLSRSETNRLSLISTFPAFLTMAVSMFTGTIILRFFGISLFFGLLLAILVVTGADYLSFRYSHRLLKIPGTTGLNVFTKVFGLIVLAIGVQFVAVGVGNLFPDLTFRP